jgi:hypothetical protein
MTGCAHGHDNDKPVSCARFLARDFGATTASRLSRQGRIRIEPGRLSQTNDHLISIEWSHHFGNIHASADGVQVMKGPNQVGGQPHRTRRFGNSSSPNDFRFGFRREDKFRAEFGGWKRVWMSWPRWACDLELDDWGSDSRIRPLPNGGFGTNRHTLLAESQAHFIGDNERDRIRG